MVTFVCSYCDQTLKKKQLERHCMGSCRPPSFICIDCHVTFNGNDYKGHTSCLTQFEKTWGEYAKPKHITKNGSQNQKAQSNGLQTEEPKLKTHTVSNVSTPKLKHKEEIQPSNHVEKVEESDWKGWKNEIKNIIKGHDSCILRDELEEKTLKRYHETNPESDLKDEELKNLIQEKMMKLKKVKLQTYIKLE